MGDFTLYSYAVTQTIFLLLTLFTLFRLRKTKKLIFVAVSTILILIGAGMMVLAMLVSYKYTEETGSNFSFLTCQPGLEGYCIAIVLYTMLQYLSLAVGFWVFFVRYWITSLLMQQLLLGW